MDLRSGSNVVRVKFWVDKGSTGLPMSTTCRPRASNLMPLLDWKVIPSGVWPSDTGEMHPTSDVTRSALVKMLTPGSTEGSASGPGPPNAKIAVDLNGTTASSSAPIAVMSPPNASTGNESETGASRAVSSVRTCEYRTRSEKHTSELQSL